VSEKVRAHIALSLVALFYGLNYVIAKDVLVKEYMTPFGFIMLRVLAGAVIFTTVHTLFVRERIERSDLPYVAMCSVFGAVVNMLCFFEGLKHTSPIHASLIMVLTPVLVLIVSAFLIKEKITALKIIGIILGLAGAALLVSNSGSGSDKVSSVYGDLMIMVNAISYGLYLVLVRRLTKKYHPFTVIKWVFLFGTIMILPFGGKQLYQTDWSSFPTDIWLAVGYVLIFATAATYLLNVFALSKVMPSTVGFYVYFQPLIATAVAILLGQDFLDAIKIGSAVMLFVGVYLVNKSPKKSVANLVKE